MSGWHEDGSEEEYQARKAQRTKTFWENKQAEQVSGDAVKYTPGPWKLCFHLQSEANDASCPCGYRGGIWSGDGEHVICEMNEAKDELMAPPIPRPETLANARLIAAAPELLRACKMAFKVPRPWMDGGASYAEWDTAITTIDAAIAKAEGKSQ